MTKSERKAQLIRDMKEGLRTENYNLLIETGKKMYNYLNKEEKELASKYAEKGKVKEAYATYLADTLIAKKNRKTITAEDVRHASRNIEMVKEKKTRIGELTLKSFRSSEKDKYYEFVKQSGLFKKQMGRPSSRKDSEIAKKMDYSGGDKKSGYIYKVKIGSQAWEIRTPGYDEDNGQLHGFQFRKVGSLKWNSQTKMFDPAMNNWQ